MTQMRGPGMILMEPDYSPEDPREGVSAEQQAIIVGITGLTNSEKARALDILSAVATGDYFWPLIGGQLDEDFANVFGLARGSDGIWRDAMVQDKNRAWVFDPSSVR